MVAKSFFGSLQAQNVKILQKVSRPERFSTEVEKTGFIPSINTNVFKILYDKTWMRSSIPGGQIVTSGTITSGTDIFFPKLFCNWP